MISFIEKTEEFFNNIVISREEKPANKKTPPPGGGRDAGLVHNTSPTKQRQEPRSEFTIAKRRKPHEGTSESL